MGVDTMYRVWTLTLAPRLRLEPYEMDGEWVLGLWVDDEPTFWDWPATGGRMVN